MKSDKPKVLHKIAGRSLLDWILATAHTLNPEKIVVVTSPSMPEVAAATGSRATVVYQENQNGTGDALKAAVPALKGFEGKVLVLLGDEPFLDKAALLAMLAWEGLSTMAVRVESPKGLGRMIVHEDGTLEGIVEEKDATAAQKEICLCSTGTFCIPAAKLEKWLSQIQPNNAQKEYYLTDLPKIAEKEGFLTYVVETAPQAVWGINTRLELAQHEAIAQKTLREQAMADGATLLDPPSTYFSFDTKLGSDVVVEPHVFFGPSVVVEKGAILHAFSHLEDVVIKEGASIGPFARIRGGAQIGEGAKIGNFVEVKKSDIAQGAKVNHLAYIGDARVGQKSNIGAGTITCNYDGYDKHQTVIGEGVFVGSNATLVAPLTIEDGAFIGAGSVVTHTAPKDALYVARAHPIVKEGWAAQYHKRKKDVKVK